MNSIFFHKHENPNSDVLRFLDAKLSNINGIISYLSLSDAGISAKNLHALFEKLQKYQITELSLSFNELRSEEAVIIATALKTSTISKVILNHNNIGDEGANAIAATLLARNGQLTVELQYNRISTAGGTAFVKAAAQTGVQKIDLRHNLLGDSGAESIAKAVASNPGSINQLVLIRNGISEGGDKALADHLPNHIAVQHRVKEIPFSEAHPFLMLLSLFIFPIFIILTFVKCDVPIDGLAHEEKRRRSD